MASRTFQIDTEHDDMIHDAVLDYYGTLLATASSDRKIKIFRVDGNKHEQIHTLELHDGPVWCVRWIHPNFTPHRLVSCGYDRKVVVWGEQSGEWKPFYESELHASSVNSVDVAPQEYGLLIVAGSSDGNLSVYAHINNEWICKIKQAHQGGVNGVSWCKSASIDQTRTFVTCGCDNTVCIWNFDLETEEITKTQALKGHNDWVRDVAWAPSPAQASVALIASCAEDNTVIIWTFRRGAWSKADQLIFSKRVWSVSWSIMGNILAVAAGEEDVKLYKEGHDGKWHEVSSN